MKSEPPCYRERDAPTADRVEDLLERMTVAEKAGQLVGTWAGHLRAPHDAADVKRAIDDHHLGAAAPFGWAGSLGTHPEEITEIVNELQEHATEETRLGIPLLFNVDAVHGHAYVAGATVFPNGLGAAATWDPDAVETAAEVTASEVRATGAHQNYSPTCDVAREPRWGRTFETFGESPFLCGEMAAAKVRGYQGDDLGDPESVIATAKHFPAYGGPDRGEDAAPVDVSEYTRRNVFVRPFEAAIEAGVESVMPSYSASEGEPAHGSERFLTDLLREDLGFDGHTASDWNGVRHLFEDHGTARDHADAVRQARRAGLDMASVGHAEHAERLVELVEEGEVGEGTIDESVRRLLRVKFEMGLFEDPYVDGGEAEATVGSSAHREVARDAARESMTLLQNDGLLPLEGDEDVFVGGPNADDMIHQLGGWSVHEDTGLPGETIVEGIEARTDGDVSFEQGTTLNEPLDIDAAVEQAADADVAVLALGEGWYIHEFGPSGEAGVGTDEWPSRRDLHLPDAQRELVERVHEAGTPVVGVLVTGRPLIVNWLAENAAAILMAYYPGTEGGAAVAETLLGENDPSGRLPISMPRSMGDLPQLHDYAAQPHPIGDHEHPDSYDPLFAFGHGLSYTTFETAGLEATRDAEAGEVRATVEVSNTGDRAGTETVQVYARQEHASRVRPRHTLVGFERVGLDPGESAAVRVTIPDAELGFHKPGEGHVVENGVYRLCIDDFTASVTVGDGE